MRIVKYFAVIILLLFVSHCSYGGLFRFTDSTKTHLIGKYTEILEDPAGSMSFEQVINAKNFTASKDDVPHFGITKSTCWLKFEIENDTHKPLINLTLQYPALDYVVLYTVARNGSYTIDTTGE